MADNIFNYFSSKGTRKVDPIDDAEFESIDAPAAPKPAVEPPPAPSSPFAESEGQGTPQATQISSPVAQKSAPTGSAGEMEPAPVQGKKQQSHWDYLASLLGIKKETAPETVVAETAPAAVQPAKPVAQAKRETVPPASRPHPVTAKTESSETPKEAAILKSLFQPVEPAPDMEVERSRKVDSSAAEETDLEYVEFEVEDLEGNSDEDPRRTRRQAPRESEPRPRSDRARRPAGERTASDRTGGERTGSERPGQERTSSERSDSHRPSHERASSERSEGQRPSRERTTTDRPSGDRPAGDRDRDRPRGERSGNERTARPTSGRSQSNERREESAEVRPPSEPRSRQPRDESRRSSEPRRETRPEPREPRPEPRREEREYASRNPSAEIPEESGFGSGIFADDTPRDEPPYAEDGQRKKRRRRRRGRGGASSDVEPVAGLPRNTVSPEVDPPDDFFDEIGWQPSTPARSASPPAGRSPQSTREDYSDEFESDSEQESLDVSSPDEGNESAGIDRKKRRRRRRGKRPGETETVSNEPDRTVKSGARNTTGRESFDDDIEDEDHVDYDQAHRNPRRAPVDESRLKDDDDDASEKKKKFPTWEEAIAGMVESNIKNHSRYSGQNRTAKRGRRRR